MLIGHYSSALVAKAYKPDLPLWQLFIAAQLVDIVWVLLVFGNIELMHVDTRLKSNPLDLYYMPFTHSLFATALWSMASLLCVWLAFKQRYGHALLLAAVVGSHWFLDFIVHRPDLLLFGDIKVGLALWNTPWLALAIEFTLFCGAAFYCLQRLSDTHLKKVLLLLFSAMALFNVASFLVPMPTNKNEILMSALAIYITAPFIAFWLERKYKATTERAVIAS